MDLNRIRKKKNKVNQNSRLGRVAEIVLVVKVMRDKCTAIEFYNMAIIMSSQKYES